MNLYKTTFLSLISTLVKTVVLFIINKFISIVGGPSGMAMLGNFQNLFSVCQVVSGTQFQTGVTKFTSENAIERDFRFLRSALQSSLPLVAIIGLILILYRENVTSLIFSDINNSWMIILWVIILPFSIFNQLISAFLNGIREINKYIALNISNSLISLVAIVILGYFFKMQGVIIGYVSFHVISFAFVLYIFGKNNLRQLFRGILQVDNLIVKKLMNYSLLTLSSILISNTSLFIIRQSIINYSEKFAGIWQGVWSLSQVILSIVSISLSTYLLPTLSSAVDTKIIRSELKRSLKLILPSISLICVISYFSRDIIISMLFTDEFTEMRELFLPQFSAVILRSISWIYGFVLIAKAKIKVIIISDLILSTLFVLANLLLLRYTLYAPVVSYLIISSLHILIMYSLVNQIIYKIYDKD